MSSGLQLVMSQGPNPGRAYALDRASATLGRDPTNEITINEPQVSRLHARVFAAEGKLVVEDMGSTNGTFVNGVRLTGPQTLAPGDVIGLGEVVTLTFYSTGAVSTAAMGAPEDAAPGPRPSPSFSSAPPPAPAPRPDLPPLAPEPMPGPEVHRPRYEPEPDWDDEAEDEDQASAKRRQRLLVGCGCLALFLACLAVALFLWFAPASFWEFLIGLGIPIPPNPF